MYRCDGSDVHKHPSVSSINASAFLTVSICSTCQCVCRVFAVSRLCNMSSHTIHMLAHVIGHGAYVESISSCHWALSLCGVH